MIMLLKLMKIMMNNKINNYKRIILVKIIKLFKKKIRIMLTMKKIIE